MVIEYLPGGELKAALKRKKFWSEKTIKKLMKNLLLGLKYIHKKGIMHRDLKPENLILRDKRRIEDLSIVDFGLSTFKNVKKYLHRRCGTPGYVAPEILNLKGDDRYDEKCDIFSAGVIYYIL